MSVSDRAGQQIIVPKKHLGVLDMLRGFAALSVLFFHFASEKGIVKFYSPTFSSWFTWGNKGVEVFFVISGFIIPYSLWGTGYKASDFFRFMAKRLLRIAPPAYICIALILVQWLVIDYIIKHEFVSRAFVLPVWQLVRNLLFSYSWMSPRWINPVFWTLAIEVQFYVLVGLIYGLVFEKRAYNLIVLFLGITAVWFAFGVSKFTFLGYAPLFAMGGVTLLYNKQRIPFGLYLIVLFVFASIVAFVFSYSSAAFGLAAAVLIAFVNIQHSVFSFFGKISYSLYLTHLLVGSTADFLLAKFYQPQTELGNMVAIACCALLAVAFAYFYYRVVEVPFMRAGRHLKL